MCRLSRSQSHTHQDAVATWPDPGFGLVSDNLVNALCYTLAKTKPNFDHLSAALRQVGVVVTATGLVTGVFNADQGPLSLGITLGGLALIWAASLEN